ncbi:DUF2076 domain-containing protein [uncultured Bradyrhizobium sp.]|uniref:DUF2076 domain-containing protein n=1 Tax=uncultured Bradyrhizobium sp. TaxID=199684 RepID=UPI0035C9D7D9
MNPQERQLVDDLFDRLSKLETAPRDPDAVAAIAQGLRRAPNAVYALVQTTLLQDEALKRAHARIQELEGGEPERQQSGGFLDSMRDAIFGQTPARGSVPNVRPPEVGGRPAWNTGQVLQQGPGPGQYNQGQYGQPYGAPQAPVGGGGSFLGTAAATAAGMVGGGLLMSSIRSMMGGGHQSGYGDSAGLGGGSRTPWSSDQSGGDLARDAGLNDIGSGGHRVDDDSHSGFFDSASNDQADMDLDSDNFGGDGGDSDSA